MTVKAAEGKDVLTLAAKLAKVAGAVSRIEKKGFNKDQKYAYATAADVFDAVRVALAAERVALIFSIEPEYTKFEEGKTSSGGLAITAYLWIVYTFVDGDSGEKLTVRTVGTARDSGQADKAVYKAQTNALKYVLFQVFQISTGEDDVEKDSSPEPKEAKPAARRAAAKAPADEPKPATAAEITVAITPEQTEDIRFLNAALGESKWTGKFLRQQLNNMGAEKLIASLAEDHKKDHGVECPHYTNGADGAIVVKRG